MARYSLFLPLTTIPVILKTDKKKKNDNSWLEKVDKYSVYILPMVRNSVDNTE